MALAPGIHLGPYEILAPLGAGGMGEVYRARDTRLGRDVAIKVLPAPVFGDEDARRRFRQEALALARLNHPHIRAVYELGTQADTDYLVLEFVPGETLAQRIADGPLAEREAVELGAQVAEALEEAHDCGVLHRDLKPGNIVVTPKGRAKVLDFGLARMLQPSGDATLTAGITQVGHAPGTLAYMAPEQLLDHPVDGRTDLYALGVTLYEITTGQRPFHAVLGTALTNEILHAPLTRPRTVQPKLSPQLEVLILRCMERDPARRYQTPGELWGELRRLGARLATVSDAAMGDSYRSVPSGDVTLHSAEETPARRITSIAVLPLENLSGDPEQEYFADGMTEELIATLAQIRALRTISRTSVMRYKGARKPVEEIARELNVDAIVEGSVRRSGERVRITAQLVDARSDRHLWAKSYERDLRDIFALQGEVAAAIVGEIQVNLTPHEEAQLRASRQVHPRAFEAYLKGRYHWDRRTEDSLKRGLAHFQEATTLDPTYALAYVGIADAYNLLGYYAILRPDEAFPMARAAAHHALELDAGSGEAHASLAYALLYHDWDFAGAEREFRIAIELAPHYLIAHLWYGNVLLVTRRFEEAEAEFQIARSIDPLSMISLTSAGWVKYYSHRFADAVQHFHWVLELDSQFQQARHWLGLSLTQLGRHEEAAAEFARCIETGGRNPYTLAGAAYAAASAGKAPEARALLAEIEKMSSQRYVSAYFLTMIRLALGERDRALDALERAIAERTHWLAFVLVDPVLLPLREEPRFEEIVKRVAVPG